MVIFGASGDLSKRKLIPALYHLEQEGYLPERYAVVGFSRTEMTDEAYRERMIGEIREDIPDLDAGSPLFKALHYQPGNNTDLGSFQNLKAKLDALDAERDLPGNRLFYLSVAPEFFTPIIRNLEAAGLVRRPRRGAMVARDHREALRARSAERPGDERGSHRHPRREPDL